MSYQRALRPRNTPLPVTPTKDVPVNVVPLKRTKLVFETPIQTKRHREAESLPSPAASPKKQCVGVSHGLLSLTARVKACLQRSASTQYDDVSGCLVSRRTQFDQVIQFLNNAISEGKSDSLYITGPPGTGKTAQLNSILKHRFTPVASPVSPLSDITNLHDFVLPNGNVEKVAIISINCITVNDPSSIFNKIYLSFLNSDRGNRAVPQRYSVKTMLDLKNFMTRYASEMTFIVILDEMDKLVHTNSASVNATKVIFELFLLAKLPEIRLLLIGIANSLDLKDRFLSRLNLKQELLPETVVFQPYTADQMYEIINHRINSVLLATEESLFNPMAIRFAAKKCSGNTGDLRKLLDILRNSVEVMELERITASRRCVTDENDRPLPAENKPMKVGLQHIAKVFTQINNTQSTKSMITKLNMQQRIVLCTLIHRQKIDIFQGHCTIDDAYDYYLKLLRGSENFVALKRNEFLEICNALEMMGVATITTGRISGKRRGMVKLIKGTVDNNEFKQEMSKFDILKELLII